MSSKADARMWIHNQKFCRAHSPFLFFLEEYMLDSSNFYKVLRSLRKTFSWSLDDANNIVATNGGNVYNPILAIAASVGVNLKGYSCTNKRDTLKVARALGLDQSFAEQVYNAAKCSTNRGQTQIVRGKVKKALGL